MISHLDFCISVFAGSTLKLTQRLQSILNASARLIFHSSRYSPVSLHLCELRRLPVKARIQQQLVALAHSCLYGKAPSYLADELQRVATQPGRSRLRSSSSRALVVPRSRHPTLGGRSFYVSAARAWNALPNSLSEAADCDHFKTMVKNHLLHVYFTQAS